MARRPSCGLRGVRNTKPPRRRKTYETMGKTSPDKGSHFMVEVGREVKVDA
jgi:hypothetical protein